ncbi:hypothetical protein HPT27_04555 [Permianibacter sp. IMCC34836]|uniref:arginine deiminase-related protein n=1 Tax=Permianibacter fluminis TaxID=2738515 RepID=UPI00155628F4|nr:arginine deiminase-related protein [Permianibacter fluminis]NQD36286.1 hypothetical protein [Permianibacter fluminis]
MRPHITDTVVMVPPDDFAFNEQTARDNDFQHRDRNAAAVRERALAEAAAMVASLRAAGVQVLLLGKGLDTPPLPDAVFPNNWFSTWPDGRLQLYPMRTANRQAEVRPQALTALLQEAGFRVQRTTQLAAAPGQALEGTGALVFDHLSRRLFAARSERCDSELVQVHAAELGYQPVLFDTRASSGRPFYHSNVMLSIGERFALICPEALPNRAERAAVLAALTESGRELVELSLDQTEQGFCANLLQLQSRAGERLLVLSQTAFDHLSAAQRERLGRHGRLLPVAIPTIEAVGGGSARCMLAEVFLPRADDVAT